jgi:hypothetical protein
MNKEDVWSLFVYLGMIAIALIIGFSVLQPAITDGNLIKDASQGQVFGYLLLAIVIGILLNSLFLELGHALGAKIGGYNIISFNILGLEIATISKDGEKKKKVRFFKPFDGLVGETKIIPEKEKSNPIGFIIIPLIFFLLEAVAMYCAFIFIPDEVNGYFNPLNPLKYGIIIVAAIGLMFALYDYIPLHIDTTTDGYRLTLLTKQVNVEAYNELLSIEGKSYLGEKIAAIKEFKEVTDFTTKLNVLGAYLSFDNSDIKSTIDKLDYILNNQKNLTKSTIFEVKVDKIFFTFLKSGKEAGEKEYDALTLEERKSIAGCNSMKYMRLYILYAGLVENSPSEVEYCLKKERKVLDREEPFYRDREERYFALAKEKVEQK